MNSSLHSENSFIIDRSWERINPENELKVSITKAKSFITLLFKEHQKLGSYTTQSIAATNPQQLNSKIHSFFLKYIQQKQLGFLKKGEIPFVKEAQYMFDLGDCLEVWRWVSGDISSSAMAESRPDDFLTSNQFAVRQQPDLSQSKRPDLSSKSKRVFKQLSLEQQEAILKKSLEMVHMYKNQLKIPFKHYCRFAIENQHRRAETFDDISLSLEIMTLNRFMLFCRDFDIIKIIEFKRKTEHDQAITKKMLLSIFRKIAHLQKYLNFEGFLLAIVQIALKIHENIDPRSYIHIELMLNALHVRYHHSFTNKLDSLAIKYSPNDFYNCYKDILKKARPKHTDKITLFDNPHFRTSEPTASRYIDTQQAEQAVGDRAEPFRNYQSVTHLGASSSTKLKVKTQQLQKRKGSLPLLPSISNNRFFKPIQHNHHKNTYSKYLKGVEDTSSVFKNRITGYSNINTLKQKKPFHLSENPEAVSKHTLNELIEENKQKIQTHLRANNLSELSQQPSVLSEAANQSSLLYSKTTIAHETNPSSPHRFEPAARAQQPSIGELESNPKQRNKVIKQLGEKVDLKDNDEILRKHLDAEQQRARSTSGRPTRQQLKS